LLSVALVAERLGVSEGLVYAWCRRKVLPHLRLGGRGNRGRIRISEADLADFLADRKVSPPGVPEGPPPPAANRRRGLADFSAYHERVMQRVAAKKRRR
jgi:excisionase family DNA binding protein